MDLAKKYQPRTMQWKTGINSMKIFSTARSPVNDITAEVKQLDVATHI